MDLRGLQRRRGAIMDERSRMNFNTEKSELTEVERYNKVYVGFSRLCEIAEWHGGKGPRSTSDPIVLSVGRLARDPMAARITALDRGGEPVDHSSAHTFMVKVTSQITEEHSEPVAEQWITRPQFREAEQTLQMLVEAIKNPELNPKFCEAATAAFAS